MHRADRLSVIGSSICGSAGARARVRPRPTRFRSGCRTGSGRSVFGRLHSRDRAGRLSNGFPLWLSAKTRARCSSSCSRAGRATPTSAGCSASTARGERSRARRALTELGGIDPDTQVGLTDYLLGQADPIGRADAARPPAERPRDRRPGGEARHPAARARPEARLPELPGYGGAAPLAAPAPGGPTERRAGHGRSGRGRRPRRRRTPLVRGRAGLRRRVRARSEPASGGSRSSCSAPPPPRARGGARGSPALRNGSGDNSSSGDTTTAGIDRRGPLKLAPQNGSGASGQAVIARVQDQPVLQINLTGLQAVEQCRQLHRLALQLRPASPSRWLLSRPTGGGNLSGAAPIPVRR